MSTGGISLTCRLITGFSALAALSVVNVASSVFGFNRAQVEGPLQTTFVFQTRNAFLILAVAAGLAGVLGLVVIRLAPRTGWLWLLPGGTVLTTAVALPWLADPPSRELLGNPGFNAALGAGPVLVIMGLLAAAHWLMHTASMGLGGAVAGTTLAAPLLGAVLMAAIVRTGVDSFVPPLRALNLTLAAVSVAGAIGVLAVLPKVRRQPAPPPLTARMTAIGVTAALLPAVPTVVARLTWDPRGALTADPADPFRANQDDLISTVVLCGLLIFVAAVGLSAALGTKALGATLAAGLVLYGATLPVNASAWAISNAGGMVVLGVLAFAAGLAAAVSRWRPWCAGVTCVAAGILTLVSLTGDGQPSGTAWLLLPVAVFAAVTAFATVTTVAEGVTAPAVLGLLAVTVQIGLTLATMLTRHSRFAGNVAENRTVVVVLAGSALLLGGLLAAAARMIRTPEPEPADQAELVR